MRRNAPGRTETFRYPFFTIIGLFCLWIALPVHAQTVIRVNAGGPAYTDSLGHVWSADTGFNTGNTYSTSSAIAGTVDDALYQVGRFDPSPDAPTLKYSFTVPNGWYEVRLHFAEPGLPAGGRVFNVTLEGVPVFGNVDVAAEVGLLTALVKSAAIAVADGQLNIEFFHGNWDPFIDAIEILSTDAPSTPAGVSSVARSATQVNLGWQPSTDATAVAAYQMERCAGASCTNFAQISWSTSTSYIDSGLSPVTTYRYRIRAIDDAGNVSPYSRLVSATTSASGPFTPIRVNSGGGSYTDTVGHVWSADTGFNTGSTFPVTGPVAGTSDSALYENGRFDPSSALPNLKYSFAVPIGSYDVRLHFADTFGGGSRRFSVALEGTTVLANLDVGAEVGAFTALVKNATVQVTDGKLDFEFLFGASPNTPIINAIEVLQPSGTDNQPPLASATISATPVSSIRIDLSWGAAPDNIGTTGYRIERCQGIGCTNFSEVAAPSATTYSDTALSPATTYRYRLRAVDAAGNYSPYSAVAAATTFTASDTQPPTTPTSLIASASSASQIGLSWAASTDNTQVVGYRVERCQGASCSNFLQIAASTGTSYTDADLAAGTLYRYRVRAADAVPNFSSYSSIATATTPAGGGDTEPPTAPSPLTAAVAATNRIDLSWGAASDNVAVVGYLVERCAGTGCSNFAQLATLPTVLAYPDTGLTGGTTYRYRVRAKDAAGNLGPYSAIVTASTTAGTGRAGSTTYQYDSFGRLKQVTVTPQ